MSDRGRILRYTIVGVVFGLLGIMLLSRLEPGRAPLTANHATSMLVDMQAPPVPPLRFATKHHTFVEVLVGDEVRPETLLPLIGHASAIALDSVGGRLLVTLDDRHTIVAFDVQSLLPATTWCVDGPGLPCSDLVYCDARGALLASDPGSTALVPLPAQGGLVKAIHLPTVLERWPATTDATGSRVLRSVVLSGTLQEAVEVFEPERSTSSRVVALVGGRPALDERGGTLYLSHPRRHEVAKVAVASGRVLARRSFGEGKRPWHEFPANVLADTASKRIYLPMQDHSDTVLALDGLSLKTVWSAKVGHRPTRIALDPHRRRLYVTHLFDYRLFVLDADTGKVVSVLEYDDLPLTVLPDPRSGRVFIQFAGMVSVLSATHSSKEPQRTTGLP